MGKVPDLTLNNGLSMPVIGLGTWQGAPGEIERAIEEALQIGYRHFDCAHVYENEEAIGNVLKQAIDGGDVKRDELFITTKLPVFLNQPALVRDAFNASRKALKLDYIDLYLIHLPVSFNGDQIQAQGMNSPFEKPPNPSAFFNHANHIGVWREMEKLVDEGLIKSIGLSNFNQAQIQNVLNNSRIRPAVLQVECHPYLPQRELIEFCKNHQIVVTAYSPLGSPQTTPLHGSGAARVLLEDPVLKRIAEQNKKSVAQILLHWLIQRNVGVLPKSVKKTRLEENLDVFNFNLSQEDVVEINKLGEANVRYIDFAFWKDSPDYSFN